jgi:imidazolonepropionase-like amidohydrolase
MTHIHRLLPVLVAVLCAASLSAQVDRGHLTSGALAITNVTVIPMTTDTVLHGATVVVRDGRIVAVGPARDVPVPTGARRIDGKGRYLIPGLADMHVHLYADGAVPDSVAPYELGVMVANGVTAVRIMSGTPEHFGLRADVAAGRVRGPQLWIASPQFAGKPYENTRVVTTPEEARVAVRQMADSGYDFIKLTLHISRPVYDAVVDEARRAGIRVIGHVDPQVGVARAIAAGQQIEHLDNYFEVVLADSAPMKESVSGGLVYRLQNWPSLDFVDDRKLAAVAGATARAGIWSVPTLVVFNEAFAIGHSDEEIRRRPDWALMPAEQRELYLKTRTRYWSAANAEVRTDARRRRYVQVRNALVKAIHDSGGRIMTGSDTPEWFHAYGFGLHRELQALVQAGLTPWQALEAATRNPAEFLGGARCSTPIPWRTSGTPHGSWEWHWAGRGWSEERWIGWCRPQPSDSAPGTSGASAPQQQCRHDQQRDRQGQHQCPVSAVGVLHPGPGCRRCWPVERPRAHDGLRLLEGLAQRAGGREPFLGCARERPEREGLDRDRHRWSHVAERPGRFGDRARDDRLGRGAGEGRFAQQHLVEDRAERVDVGPRVDDPTGGLFGTQVGGRAGFATVRPPQGARDAEVGDKRMSLRQQDVLGLDVPMDDPFAVGVVQRVRRLPCDAERVGHRERTLAHDPVGERLALDEGHREPELAAVLAGVVHGEDVGMLQPSRHAHGLAEPLAADGCAQVPVQQLERHPPVMPNVVRPEHRGHAAAAQFTVEAIAVAQGLDQAGKRIGHGGNVRRDRPGRQTTGRGGK